MEQISLIPGSEMIAGLNIKTNLSSVFLPADRSANNTFVDHLISEGGEIFFHYLNGLGLAYKQNMMVLSSRHNFYYDPADLIGVSMLINMKRLNRMRHMDGFLSTISHTLLTGSLFTGCFSDHKNGAKNDQSGKLKRKSFNYSDSSFENETDRDEVTRILESFGFKVMDMTEIKGLTYFLCSI